jgi:hypothetical protein
LLGALYSVLGAGLAISYVPQALAAWRESGAVKGTSLVAWIFWTLYGAVALAYAASVLRDPVLIAINASSLVGCATTTAIIAGKRLRYGRRAGEPLPRSAQHPA